MPEHEEEVEGTTREGSVEERKETNSMQQENEVSNRHMTWWRNAWWIRVNNGPHMRTARGRRRTWRAARRAAEQALMTTGLKRPRVLPKRYRERNGEEKKGRETDHTMQRKHSAPRYPLAHNHNPNDTNKRSGSSNAATVAAEYILVKLEDCQEKDELLATAGRSRWLIRQQP